MVMENKSLLLWEMGEELFVVVVWSVVLDVVGCDMSAR